MSTSVAVRDGGKTSEEGAMRLFSKAFTTTGVLGTNDLKLVEVSPTPNMSVDILVGDILIPYLEYVYHGWITEDYNLAISPNSSGNPRKDIVVAWIDRSVVDDSVNDNPGVLKFTAVEGTPGVTPTVPVDADIEAEIGEENPYRKLGEITVPDSTADITNSDIVDVRVQALLSTSVVPLIVPAQFKSFSLDTPSDAEDRHLFYTTEEIEIEQLVAVLVGDSTPSLTWTIRFAANRNDTGTEVVTGGTTTTSVTSGSVITSLSNAVIPANRFVWFETTAQSGNVNEIGLTIAF